VAAARSCLLAHGPAGTACTAPCCAWTASERASASVWRVKAWYLISEPVRCRSSLSLIATPLRSRGHVRRRRRPHRPWWMSVTQVAGYRRSMNPVQRPARHGLGHVTPASVASCWLSQKNRRQQRPSRPARPVNDGWRPASQSSPDPECSPCTIGYLAMAAGWRPGPPGGDRWRCLRHRHEALQERKKSRSAAVEACSRRCASSSWWINGAGPSYRTRSRARRRPSARP